MSQRRYSKKKEQHAGEMNTSLEVMGLSYILI